MKVILTNSNLVFRKEKEYVDFNLQWAGINSTTGLVTPQPGPGQYYRVTTLRKLSVSSDGVMVMPNIGSGISNGGIVYLYDSNENYIGYGMFDDVSFVNGVAIQDVLSIPDVYKDGNNDTINKDTAITNTAFYVIGLSNLGNFGDDLTGLSFGVR